MEALVKERFGLFVLIGASIFTLMAVVVLLSFRAIFNKLDRGQREMDEELRKQGVR